MSARAEMDMHEGDLRCSLVTDYQRTTFKLTPLEAMALSDALKEYANKVLLTNIRTKLEGKTSQLGQQETSHAHR